MRGGKEKIIKVKARYKWYRHSVPPVIFLAVVVAVLIVDPFDIASKWSSNPPIVQLGLALLVGWGLIQPFLTYRSFDFGNEIVIHPFLGWAIVLPYANIETFNGADIKFRGRWLPISLLDISNGDEILAELIRGHRSAGHSDSRDDPFEYVSKKVVRVGKSTAKRRFSSRWWFVAIIVCVTASKLAITLGINNLSSPMITIYIAAIVVTKWIAVRAKKSAFHEYQSEQTASEAAT